MVINKKVTGKAISMPLGVVVGLAISIVVTLITVGIMAQLVLGEKMKTEVIGYGSMATLLLSSAAGAWVAAKMVKHRWMVVCLGAGAVYFLTLLACTALFFGGQYEGVGVTFLVVLAGSGAVGLLGLKGENSGAKKRRKRRTR